MNEAAKNRKKVWAIIGGIAVAVILAVVFLALNNSDAKRLQRQLDTAHKYLMDMDYEQAVAAYEIALSIDDRCVEAYLGLADAYIGLGDADSAAMVLTKGYEITGDGRIEEKLLVALDGIRAETYIAVADVYLSLGNTGHAVEILQDGYNATKDECISAKLQEIALAEAATETAAAPNKDADLEATSELDTETKENTETEEPEEAGTLEASVSEKKEKQEDKAIGANPYVDVEINVTEILNHIPLWGIPLSKWTEKDLINYIEANNIQRIVYDNDGEYYASKIVYAMSDGTYVTYTVWDDSEGQKSYETISIQREGLENHEGTIDFEISYNQNGESYDIWVYGTYMNGDSTYKMDNLQSFLNQFDESLYELVVNCSGAWGETKNQEEGAYSRISLKSGEIVTEIFDAYLDQEGNYVLVDLRDKERKMCMCVDINYKEIRFLHFYQR